MIIRPHPKLREWFLVNFKVAKPTYGRPGMKLDGNYACLPRNLLPLIEHPDVLKELSVFSMGSDLWEARNTLTKARGFVCRTTQHEAIDFIVPRRGVLLGDEMRLGKTLSALMSHRPETGPLVVIAPLATRATWLMWIKRVFPDLEPHEISVLTGRKFDPERIRGRKVVFAHFDIMQAWQTPLDIGTLVIDEAHLVVNHKTRRALACSWHAARAQKVIAMTGTPIWDLPADLWSVLHMITPGAWGDYHSFCKRYGLPVPTAYGTQYTGLSNGEELRARMSEVMLRRLWRDRADDVPPISRSVIIADLNDVDRRRLDIIAAALKSERTNTAGNLAAYRRQVSLFKLSTIKQEVAKVVDRGEPVVVWTWHTEFAEQLASALRFHWAHAPEHQVFVINGDIAITERERRIEAWKQTSNGVLVAGMPVAQAGIDLSHARIAIFAEIDFTPAVLGQAEMRTFSPLRGMDIIFVIANHIVDQRIVRALINKLSAANPLGVGAAVEAIDALRDAVMGPQDEGDLDRLFDDLLASAA